MPRIKSLLLHAKVDAAGKAHNCQANAHHRINRGDIRLAVRNGRGWDYYCQECAQNIINHDLEKLAVLRLLQPSNPVQTTEPDASPA